MPDPRCYRAAEGEVADIERRLVAEGVRLRHPPGLIQPPAIVRNWSVADNVVVETEARRWPPEGDP